MDHQWLITQNVNAERSPVLTPELLNVTFKVAYLLSFPSPFVQIINCCKVEKRD